MSESAGRTILFTVLGLVFGSVVGALTGYLVKAEYVSVQIYNGIGLSAVIGAITSGLLGLMSNGVGGMIGGIILGGVVGGMVDFSLHPPADLIWGWGVGLGLGVAAGLVSGFLAPPESKLKGR